MYSVVLWGDERIDRQVQPIRRKYDRDFPHIGPHVTVSFPIETEEALPDIIRRMAGELQEQQPFDITFDEVRGYRWFELQYPVWTTALVHHFPNCRNMIALPVAQGNEELLRIRKRLSDKQAFPQNPRLLPYPHFMAVAQALGDAEYREAVSALTGFAVAETLRVTGLDVLEKDAGGSWITKKRFEWG